jgi:three-Cys-motif partner protein
LPKKTRRKGQADAPTLFDLSAYPVIAKELEFKPFEAPVWTENKAQLIQRYLRYFVYITKHGTYLDLFAGPQRPKCPNSWAAEMVLTSEPRRLRNFSLFEKDPKKIAYLKKLRKDQPAKPKRNILLHKGDTNVNLPTYLRNHPIKEACFCLIDQRTFECDWDTVKSVASHKADGNKIEIFYFLAQGWLDRAIAGLTKNRDADLNRWWGNDTWKILQKKPASQRGNMLSERFKNELGYKYAYPYPIYERNEGGQGKVMFWMIHASDHPEAPKIMVRAYKNAVAPLEPMEQLEMEIGNTAKINDASTGKARTKK